MDGHSSILLSLQVGSFSGTMIIKDAYTYTYRVLRLGSKIKIWGVNEIDRFCRI